MAQTKKEEAPVSLFRRLLRISEDAEVPKSGVAPQQAGGFPFHRIDDVEGVLKPLCIKHGVAIVPTLQDVTFEHVDRWNIVNVRLGVRFVNVDDPSDSLELTTFGQGYDLSDKAVGKAWSYATKTLYLALFHLKGQPDVEADSPSESEAPKRKPPVRGVKRAAANAWDATEVVPFGKNAGTPWAELTIRQLQWYAENANEGIVRKAAGRELQQREHIPVDPSSDDEIDAPEPGDDDEFIPPSKQGHDDPDLPF